MVFFCCIFCWFVLFRCYLVFCFVEFGFFLVFVRDDVIVWLILLCVLFYICCVVGMWMWDYGVGVFNWVLLM